MLSSWLHTDTLVGKLSLMPGVSNRRQMRMLRNGGRKYIGAANMRSDPSGGPVRGPLHYPQVGNE